MLLAAVLATIAGAEPARAATAIECAAHKGSGGYYSWREVDGRRCWYPGRRRLDKATLYWPAEARQAAADRAQATTRPTRPPAAPVPAQAEAGAVLVTIGERWPASDWTELYRSVVSDAAVVAPAGPPLRRDVPIAGQAKPAAMDRRHPPSLLPTMVALVLGIAMMGAGAMIVTSGRSCTDR